MAQARAIIEERLGFWVTISTIVLVVGIIAAVYLFWTVPSFLNFAIRRTQLAGGCDVSGIGMTSRRGSIRL